MKIVDKVERWYALICGSTMEECLRAIKADIMKSVNLSIENHAFCIKNLFYQGYLEGDIKRDFLNFIQSPLAQEIATEPIETDEIRLLRRRKSDLEKILHKEKEKSSEAAKLGERYQALVDDREKILQEIGGLKKDIEVLKEGF